LKSKISILGCGWLGTALAEELIASGYEVNGSSTSPEKISKLAKMGIQPFLIDITEHKALPDKFLKASILVIALPSQNSDDFNYLIKQIEKSSIQKILFISTTSVYADTNEIVTEASPIPTSNRANLELLFKDNPKLATTILRFGGLFGYDRKPGNFIRSDNKINNPEGYINFIHRDDCIAIIKLILSKNIWNTLLNACADTHPKRKDFYKKEMAKLGRQQPVFDNAKQSIYKIVSSEKLKKLLNYTFKYADLMQY